MFLPETPPFFKEELEIHPYPQSELKYIISLSERLTELSSICL